MRTQAVESMRVLPYPAYEDALKLKVWKLGLIRLERARMLNYGQHLYRVFRRFASRRDVTPAMDEFVASALRAGAVRVDEGLESAAVARAFAVSCELLTGRCPLQLRRLAVSYLKQWEDKGGNMEDTSQKSECRVQNAKAKPAKGRRLAKSASDPLSRMQDEPSPVE